MSVVDGLVFEYVCVSKGETNTQGRVVCTFFIQSNGALVPWLVEWDTITHETDCSTSLLFYLHIASVAD